MGSKRSSVPPDPRVARRLRAILDYHEMSAADLARRIGVSNSAISQWLSARTALSALNATKIASALGEEPDFVLGRTNKATIGYGAAISDILESLPGEKLRRIQEIEREHPGSLDEIYDDLIARYAAKEPE